MHGEQVQLSRRCALSDCIGPETGSRPWACMSWAWRPEAGRISLKYSAVLRPLFFFPRATFRPCALHSSACGAHALHRVRGIIKYFCRILPEGAAGALWQTLVAKIRNMLSDRCSRLVEPYSTS